MAQPTTQPEPVTAFLEPSQQLQTQVSDWIFRIPSPRKRAAAPAVAVLDRICATARGHYGTLERSGVRRVGSVSTYCMSEGVYHP
jgi:hypothetical protein